MKAQVVELGNGRRVVKGWRSRSVDDFLDCCVKVEGDYSREVVESGTSRTLRRWSSFEEGRNARAREWSRENLDYTRANGRKQAVVQYERLKADHAAVKEQFFAKYPGATVPGLDPFKKYFWASWKSGFKEVVIDQMYRFGLDRYSFKDNVLDFRKASNRDQVFNNRK